MTFHPAQMSTHLPQTAQKEAPSRETLMIMTLRHARAVKLDRTKDISWNSSTSQTHTKEIEVKEKFSHVEMNAITVEEGIGMIRRKMIVTHLKEEEVVDEEKVTDDIETTNEGMRQRSVYIIKSVHVKADSLENKHKTGTPVLLE